MDFGVWVWICGRLGVRVVVFLEGFWGWAVELGPVCPPN